VPCVPESRLGYCLPALNAATRVVMAYTLPVDVVPLASTALLAVLLVVWFKRARHTVAGIGSCVIWPPLSKIPWSR
jgi:hypothetical protein